MHKGRDIRTPLEREKVMIELSRVATMRFDILALNNMNVDSHASHMSGSFPVD